jgi:hypothetical protein
MDAIEKSLECRTVRTVLEKASVVKRKAVHAATAKICFKCMAVVAVTGYHHHAGRQVETLSHTSQLQPPTAPTSKPVGCSTISFQRRCAVVFTR